MSTLCWIGIRPLADTLGIVLRAATAAERKRALDRVLQDPRRSARVVDLAADLVADLLAHFRDGALGKLLRSAGNPLGKRSVGLDELADSLDRHRRKRGCTGTGGQPARPRQPV